MHELSLAQSLLSTADSIAKENNASRITKIYVKIGQFALVMQDQLEFSFNIMKSEYDTTKQADILITWEKGVLECKDCGFKGETNLDQDEETYGLVSLFRCPECNSYATEMISGNQTFIDKIDVSKMND